MQDIKERAKIAQYYWKKVEELGSEEGAAKFLQYKQAGSSWYELSNCSYRPSFDPYSQYRIKPETATHKGGEYPKPCTVEDALSVDHVYTPSWEVDPYNGTFSVCAHLHARKVTKKAFAEAGLAHLTEESALAHAKVLFQIED